MLGIYVLSPLIRVSAGLIRNDLASLLFQRTAFCRSSLSALTGHGKADVWQWKLPHARVQSG